MLTLEIVGIAKRSVRSNSTLGWFSPYDGNIIGGALLGIGMSLTGACPGTVVVQIAQGFHSSRATMLGALLGGAFYAKLGKFLKAKNNSGRDFPQAQTIGAKLGFEPGITFLAFESLCLAVVALSTLILPGRSYAIMPTVVGGLLIGAAQAISILLTANTLGMSTAYEQAGRYLWPALGFKDVSKPATFPKAITFAIGTFCGSLIFAGNLQSTTPMDAIPISPTRAFIGGFAMTFGARMAGGCTSGHGLSGLASLSFSSLVTVMAMFGMGIGTQMLQRYYWSG